MVWITVGLFAVGVICGTLIRLLVFVGVLAGGGVIAAVAAASHGLGAALWAVLVTVIALQVGYVAGFILRAIGLPARVAALRAGKSPVNAPLGQKRR